jgi:NAD(P)-dependent dehydrogenase (short-subunit alcohol dehydrogenase family)
VIGPRSPLLERPTTDDPVASDLLRVFSVNVIGSWNVVDAFQAKMGKGGKIMLMTSSFASMERTTHAQAPSYSIAKASLRHWTPGWDPSWSRQAGVNMLGRKLAVELKDRGIDVVLMSPGVVRTVRSSCTSTLSLGRAEQSQEIAGWVGEIEPEESAACIRRELEKERTNGQFLRYDGNGLPW